MCISSVPTLQTAVSTLGPPEYKDPTYYRTHTPFDTYPPHGAFNYDSACAQCLVSSPSLTPDQGAAELFRSEDDLSWHLLASYLILIHTLVGY